MEITKPDGTVIDLPDYMLITVCSACLRAGCWHTVEFCEDYKTAGTRDLTVAALAAIEHEDPSVWLNDARAQEYIQRMEREVPW